ncbi:hypothetical protein [Rhodoligotrophos defluvii]|uniref:hypothetical protein n=1 Tax=Rhodoligotrophos defluvii TaxID=2561934 RepID=UPI0010C9C9F1|nr:hypothetical protein [Rhodoligotrophos defluvii]
MSKARWSISCCAALLIASTGGMALASEDLENTPSGQCWHEHTLCNEAAFGEEAWRGACYADLTSCLKTVRPARCMPGAARFCADFLARCQDVGAGSPSMQEQCQADHDACLLSFGC